MILSVPIGSIIDNASVHLNYCAFIPVLCSL